MIRVRTPSRLHFGLLSIPSAHAPERRSFGGIGLMIDAPGIELTVDFANTMSADGPLAERAVQFARIYCVAARIQHAFRIQVTAAAPEHVGLGAGTQLGLAVARAIAELTQQPERTTSQLAPTIGRGARSAIGVHGFDHGGFLVEGGKTSQQAIAPLLARYDFPAEWRVLLILPRDLQGTHGPHERDAFAQLAARDGADHLTERMSRQILLGILPALLERDLSAFGEALHDYNRCAGEMFRSVQGGIYAHPWIEATVRALRNMGIRGVGQSSWGPAVFAIVGDGDTPRLASEIERWLAPVEIVQASANNRGAAANAVRCSENRGIGFQSCLK